MDILERAVALYDRVIVAVGVNSSKAPLLTVEDRLSVLKDLSRDNPAVSVSAFDGLLVRFAVEQGAQAIVRGLRAISDFEYEFQMAMTNRRLEPKIETVLLMTNWEHSYLSSTIVREIARLGGDCSAFVPKPVCELIATRFKAESS